MHHVLGAQAVRQHVGGFGAGRHKLHLPERIAHGVLLSPFRRIHVPTGKSGCDGGERNVYIYVCTLQMRQKHPDTCLRVGEAWGNHMECQLAGTMAALNATIMNIDQNLAMATKRLDGVAATSEALERFASFVEAELEQAHYSLSVLTVYLYVIGGITVLAICHHWAVLYCLSSMKVEQETLVFV